MRAVVIDPEAQSATVETVPDPLPEPDQILVKVHASGLNRADLAAKGGGYRTGRAPGPFIAGSELAGEIVAVGHGVTAWRPGDRVMALGPGQAEYATIDARHAMPVPDAVGWTEAGGMPMAVETTFDALVTNGRLAPGDAVLITAATGIGLVGVRMAAAPGASAVIATGRSAAKLEAAADHVGALGCPLVWVDTTRDALVGRVSAATRGAGADVIVDHLGAPALADNVAAASIGGRIVQVGRLGGKMATFDLDELARKRVSLIGVTFRTRDDDDKAEVVRQCLEALDGTLDRFLPPVQAVVPLEAVLEAHAQLAASSAIGKVVLQP